MAGNQEDFLSDRDLEPLARQWMDLLKAAVSEGFQGPAYEQPATPQYSPEPAPAEEIVQTGIPFGPVAIRSLLKLFLGMGRNAPGMARLRPRAFTSPRTRRPSPMRREDYYNQREGNRRSSFRKLRDFPNTPFHNEPYGPRPPGGDARRIYELEKAHNEALKDRYYRHGLRGTGRKP